MAGEKKQREESKTSGKQEVRPPVDEGVFVEGVDLGDTDAERVRLDDDVRALPLDVVLHGLGSAAMGGSIQPLLIDLGRHIIPQDDAEANKFLGQLDRLRKATERVYSVAYEVIVTRPR